MAWQIAFDKVSKKESAQLENQTAESITAFLHKRVAVFDDPQLAKLSKGPKLKIFCEYGIGDYRIIASIAGGTLRILVVCMRNRRGVLT